MTLSGKPTMRVDAEFSADADEHYFGLGQHQNTPVDLRGLKLPLWHNYNGPGSNRQVIGFPFLISTRNYAILWDNPSRTQAQIAVNGKTSWSSEAGQAVAFYLIVADNSDGIYTQYRALTGTAPLPPKAAFGLIQSKARYASQEELTEVAEGYRTRHYPLRRSCGGLDSLEQIGRSGALAQSVARSEGHECAAPRLGLSHDDQRLARIC